VKDARFVVVVDVRVQCA